MKWFRNKLNKDNSNSSDNEDVYKSISELPFEFLDLIESNINQVIIVWNEKADIIFVSHSVQRLLGYSKEEICSINLEEIVLEPSVNSIKSNIGPLANDTQYRTNIQLLQKDHTNSWFDCMIQKLPDKAKSSTYYIAFLESIDNEKEMEEVLAKSEKLSVAGQLAAGVVHEIRNPLTSIKGFVQLMEAGMEGKQQYYDIMIEEIEKMEAMASELLFISRPPNHEMKFEDLAKMVEDCLILLSTQARQKNITLSKTIHYKKAFFCNRSQIKQVLINLIKNAIEAIDSKGNILVKINKEENLLAIDVIDDGPGVPTELINQLDQPFFTTKQHGTGLGLMVSKQLIQQHDGELVINHNKKQGTTFRILLPIENK